MKCLEVPYQQLLPIESPRGRMSFRRIPQIKKLAKSLENLPPITLIPYNDYFIVWDGHGRTTAHIYSGRFTIPSNVLENDKELIRAAIRNSREMQGMNLFIEEYKTEIQPELEKWGIKAFSDYPILKELIKRQDLEIAQRRKPSHYRK